MQLRVLVVQVESAGFDAGNFAKISINDVAVQVAKNENGHYRGLHIVIINSLDGKVELSQVFDTYKTSKGFYELPEYGRTLLQELPEGHIVCVACQDDCVSNLCFEFKQWFGSMGSQEIWELGYRCG